MMIIALFTNSCVHTNDAAPDKELKGTLFQHNAFGFSLTVPADWDNSLTETMNNLPIELVSKNRAVNNFSANIAILGTKHAGTRVMGDILAEYKKGVTSQFPGVTFLNDTIYTVQNVEIGKVIYTGELFGNLLKFKELLFIRGNNDIQIVFTDFESEFDSRTEFTDVESSLAFIE